MKNNRCHPLLTIFAFAVMVELSILWVGLRGVFTVTQIPRRRLLFGLLSPVQLAFSWADFVTGFYSSGRKIAHRDELTLPNKSLQQRGWRAARPVCGRFTPLVRRG